MNLLKRLGLIAVLITALLGCSSDSEENLGPAVTGVEPDAITDDKVQVGFPQSTYGQLFILGVATIGGAPAPTGSGLANKLVYFEKKAGKVYMFESLNGKLATDSIQTKKFLAEFPLRRSIGGIDQIDFKEGMKLFFSMRSMYASDGGAAPSESALKVTASFIDKIEQRGDSTLIRQIVRVDVPASRTRPASNQSMELRYTLTPYKKNPGFEAKESSLMKKVGYFETHPTLTAGTGKKSVKIMKFDTRKSVVYSLSRNIPAEYKQAVIDGVLYWNHVFGKDVLKVDDLPEGVSVHEPGYNIVQWLHWDTAGFAYANMVADPLTGETLQSHVYMTSVFGVGGLRRARAYYQRYLANDKGLDEKVELAIPGFQSSSLCVYDFQKSMKDLGELLSRVDMAESLNKDIDSEEVFKRYAQDYVREVVAHEVGHTLGLRHNFAGSLHTNIEADEFENVFKEYFYNDVIAKDTVIGASVMDYTPGKTASLLGGAIRQKLEPFAYDKAAIEWGYTDKKLKDVNAPLFCTDSHRAKGIYHDCKVWDRHKNTVEGAYADWKDTLLGHSFKLAMKFSFLGPKGDFAPPKPEENEGGEALTQIEKLRLFPKKDATALLKEFKALTDMATKKAQFLSVRSLFPEELSVIEEPDYRKQLAAYKSASFQKVSGLTRLLISDFTPGEDNMTPLLKELVARFEINFIKIYGEQTEEIMEKVRQKMKTYFIYLDRELILAQAVAMGKMQLDFRPEGLPDAILTLVKKTSFEMSNKIVGTATNGYEVRLPEFNYLSGDKELRKKVALLPKLTFGLSTSFNRQMKPVKEEVYKLHKVWLDAVLKDISIDQLSDELFDFVTAEKARFSGLK